MKITNALFFFFIILLPFLFYWIFQTQDIRAYSKLNKQYDGALTTAVQDAAISLKINATPTNEYEYTSKKFSNINKEASYETFIHTLSTNFGVQSKNTKISLEYYVPVYGVVEYDGFSVARFERVGESVLRVWQPKKPFTYTDASGNIFKFTLDDHVEIYDVVTDAHTPEWREGTRAELANESMILLLRDPELFDEIRRQTIVRQVEGIIENEINHHNLLMSTMGITYKFALPLITEEQWYNTIDDVGIIALIQGYPVHRLERVYNQFAFAGSRLIHQPRIFATTLNGGERVFWDERCDYDYDVKEIYTSKANAAKSGYKEKVCNF